MKLTTICVLGLALVAGQSRAQDGRWITLLDGTNMGDWTRLGAANWRLEGGAVVADKKENEKENGNFLVTKNSYKDFEIRAEFWVSDDANSGIFIRCEHGKVTATDCYEVNIFDQRPTRATAPAPSPTTLPRSIPCPRPAARGTPTRSLPRATTLSLC
jgi:hypothetical protein